MKRVCHVLLLTLASCTMGADYIEPALELPKLWRAQPEAPAEAPAPPAAAQWWKAFNDAQLDALVERALAHNQEVKIAELRILEARAVKQEAASALYPQVEAEAKADRAKDQLIPGIPLLTKPMNTGEADIAAAWELDIFGGTQRRVEAADATSAAREADLRSVRLTLAGDVANNYIAWRQLQQQEEFIRSIAEAQESSFKLIEKKREAGTASRLQALQSQSLYQATAARVPELERQRAAVGYGLSVLLGEPAGAVNDELQPPQALPQPLAIPALAAPAEIIRRRPDVQAAERELAAATALQGAAIAELFPKLSLSALFGVQHISISTLSTTSRVWSVGADAAAPLLNFGRIEGQIAQADARQLQAFQQYRRTVLAAFAEIETALSNVAKENRRIALLAAASDSAAQALSLAYERYHRGIASFLEVLAAEQQYHASQSDVIAAQALRLNYLVNLYKAIGVPAA
ncbi:MAG: efflux transporter outer membrane subunit [Alphaproteobacteria bacterium]|nr:efflux transporter outer membrane subunit [Alphaproteobacteria bacterium]